MNGLHFQLGDVVYLRKGGARAPATRTRVNFAAGDVCYVECAPHQQIDRLTGRMLGVPEYAAIHGELYEHGTLPPAYEQARQRANDHRLSSAADSGGDHHHLSTGD